MGLVLALLMGGLAAGRTEAFAARATGYFQQGQFHAAVGAWTEYLAREPGDLQAQLELARAQRVCRLEGESLDSFRQVFHTLLASRRVSEALEVFDEAGRNRTGHWLSAADLAKVAYYKEKQLDDRGALDAYRLLFEAYPEHPQGQRALVRVIVLYHGKVSDPPQARRWLERARHQMPPGSWRDFLEREFKLKEAPRESVRTGPGAGHWRPGF